MKKKENKLHKSAKSRRVTFGIILGVYCLILFIVIYFGLPCFNFQDVGFYFFLMYTIGGIIGFTLYFLRNIFIKYRKKTEFKVVTSCTKNGRKGIDFCYVDKEKYYNSISFYLKWVGAFACTIIVLLIALSLSGAKIFRAKSYYRQLSITEKTDEEFYHSFDFDTNDVQLPIIDKALSYKLAQAKLDKYGAQYQINADYFTLISVTRNQKEELLRIAPLEYSNMFVALNRLNSGTVGYIEINVSTKEARLVLVEEGLKYMPSSYFSKDLDRHVRFNYINKMFDKKYFEIDDDGNPYWVIPTYKNAIAPISGATPNSVIIVNPINGDHKEYKIGSEPEWVDRVVEEDIVEGQATNALRYKNGFFNATFGSKNEVFQVSDGYNYFIKDGHTYYVSCITSPNEADQTSIGFITIDLKTREAAKYMIPGITEMRARSIAEADERVKAQALEATWPILINYKETPTYFLVLKNEVQAQYYVFINVSNGNYVAMNTDLSEAKREYELKIAKNNPSEEAEVEITSTVERVVHLSETVEFMITDNSTEYFVVNRDLSNVSRFLRVGDKIKIRYRKSSTYNYVVGLELVE